MQLVHYNMTTTLQIQGLRFGYRKSAPLFDDLDLNLAPGAIVGLLGKNGSGKTTLLKLLAGLRHAQAGVVKVGERDAAHRDPATLAEVFLLPEEPEGPAETPDTFARRTGTFYPRFDAEHFEAALTTLDVPRDQFVARMSLGQRKKFWLAFALATRASLLLLDEPTNGLDIPSKQKVRALLAESFDPHRLIVVSTHQVRDVENLIDQVVLLEQGQIRFQATLSDVAERLRFDQGHEVPADALYRSPVPGGYLFVRPNHSGVEGAVDLEALFQLVSEHPERVLPLFAEGQHDIPLAEAAHV